MKFKPKAGFTLIELLVVVAIIGILASVILVFLGDARKNGRDARRQSDIHQIQNALELYYAQNGSYPYSNWISSNNSSWDSLQSILSPYIKELPHDPKETSSGLPAYDGNAYAYSLFSADYGCSKQWYMIVYRLEVAKGPDPGVRTCDGTFFRYGGSGANTTLKTIGVNGYPY